MFIPSCRRRWCADPRQIARAIGVSNYTVQDHLKSIFAKIGVQTRGELANEIYVRFYLPPKRAA
jgi:DNA-binding CsgD family transcriptional regulator